MSLVGVLLFIAGVFAIRVFGGFALGGVLGTDDRATRLLLLMPLSIVSAVVAVQTFTTKSSLAFDARAVGIAVAAVLSWRKVPMGLVVVIAAASTALVRLTGWG